MQQNSDAYPDNHVPPRGHRNTLRCPELLDFLKIPRAKRTTALHPLGFDIAEEGLNHFISDFRVRIKLCSLPRVLNGKLEVLGFYYDFIKILPGT